MNNFGAVCGGNFPTSQPFSSKHHTFIEKLSKRLLLLLLLYNTYNIYIHIHCLVSHKFYGGEKR